MARDMESKMRTNFIKQKQKKKADKRCNKLLKTRKQLTKKKSRKKGLVQFFFLKYNNKKADRRQFILSFVLIYNTYNFFFTIKLIMLR